MTKILIPMKKFILVAIIAALGLAALPVTSAFALDAGDDTKPPADATQATNQQQDQQYAYKFLHCGPPCLHLHITLRCWLNKGVFV